MEIRMISRPNELLPSSYMQKIVISFIICTVSSSFVDVRFALLCYFYTSALRAVSFFVSIVENCFTYVFVFLVKIFAQHPNFTILGIRTPEYAMLQCLFIYFWKWFFLSLSNGYCCDSTTASAWCAVLFQFHPSDCIFLSFFSCFYIFLFGCFNCCCYVGRFNWTTTTSFKKIAFWHFIIGM